ncbi:MAG: tRNA (adenosine(37)-N6)-threonylcarbamoyltransferase complex ATPase subunit type 1 TsaE [Prevotellaceae bacterium]|jgi:tRNA threonylcarbamoyladenosine biosynthesis protein TsaE|nr:tRNA (adenosine(37)-N6)-threonylcarbamoyltransferase complex ATPase subunit type 1 TsaE [Prevotellaceae bacterium]
MTFETTLENIGDVARKIIQKIENKRIIALYGKMGAGKTTLIKEICKEMGAKENVTSPTFSLINEYTAHDGIKIYHFDFYRINSISEVFDFGYEEYFYGDGICFIEWSEMIEELLPEDALRIYVNVRNDSVRELKISDVSVKNP